MLDLDVIAQREGLRAAITQATRAEWSDTINDEATFLDRLTLAHVAAYEISAATFAQRRSPSKNRNLQRAISALQGDDWTAAFEALSYLPESYLRDAAMRRVANEGARAVRKMYSDITSDKDVSEKLRIPQQYITSPEPTISCEAVPLLHTLSDAANVLRLGLERRFETPSYK